MIGVDFNEIIKCVACDGPNLKLVIDLGSQPLANDFLAENIEFEVYPLKLNRCIDCYHSQLSVAVNPSRLFREYSYVSGTSETLSDYFKFLADKILLEFGHSGKILDIGSNDGSFLSKFKDTKWSGLGVDPAINLISKSTDIGVITIPTFFDHKVSKLIASDFDVVVAMNIFAHTEHPLEILKSIKECLKENGRAYIQTSQADMFFSGQFDTVYHEHISFFNVKSMKALLNRAGLYLSAVSIVSIHGGSYLWEIVKNPVDSYILEREAYELQQGLYEDDLYRKFTEIVVNKVSEVKHIIKEHKEKGFLIVLFGASAKGNTFINFAGIKLDYIFDDTPQKINKFSPAGGCKVSNPRIFSEINKPALIIISAWNFADEILSRIKTLRHNHHDSFLTYYPETYLKDLK